MCVHYDKINTSLSKGEESKEGEGARGSKREQERARESKREQERDQ
jgi:hypothetical protein